VSSADPPDYYALLGIGPDADARAIRAAYRKLAKQHHPDMADEAAAASSDIFVRLQQAYDVLRDPERRAQYDRERTRRREDEAERQQREYAYRQALAGRPIPSNRAPVRVPPPGTPPPPWKFQRQWMFLGVSVLTMVAAGSLILKQKLEQAAREEQVMIVRVDPPRLPRGDQVQRPPIDAGSLNKELERASREQVARVEAARKRVEEQANNVARQSAASSAPTPAPAPPAPVRERPGRVDCKGEGRVFTITYKDGVTTVAYNGSPAVQPSIADPGTGIVIMSRVEPTNRVSLGFWKGDKDRTIVIVVDAVGNVFQTFGVECTAAAF
jgi:curved DNA-binding protein CbpA